MTNLLVKTLIQSISKMAALCSLLAISLISTGCPKPPKPKETRCQWELDSQGQWRLRCEVVWKYQYIQDVRSEVNNFLDVDITDIANPWVPDTAIPAQGTMTITTDTGYVISSTYELVYDSAISSRYAPVDSYSTPRAYLPRDPEAVRNFVNAALATGASTVDIKIETVKPTVQIDPNAPSGTYTNHVRAETSGGVSYYGSYDFFYTNPGDGDGDGGCGRRTCPIIQ